jgi:hypothetical protein
VKKPGRSKGAKSASDGSDGIAAYSRAQPPVLGAMCELLRQSIDQALPRATSKIWHGSPVWFLGEHPVVGYSATAKTVKLLFWNGQAFDEPGLAPMGKHRAAQAVFADAAEIDPKAVRRWLKEAGSKVLDSKAFIAQLRKGGRRDG